MASADNISLVPETIFHIGNIGLNSAVLTSILIAVFIIWLSLYVSKKISMVPGKLQVAMELGIAMFYDKLVDAYHGNKKLAKKHTALIFTLFIFIFIANQFSVIPLFQNIMVNGKEAFKTPTAHLSETIALALVAVIASHAIAFSMSPLKHIDNYLKISAILKVRSVKDLGNVFLELFLGLLDIIGELSKIMSLSGRLFGNIFAGEVMAIIIAGLSVYTGYLLPIPFYILGIFSGVIQALVFALLSLSFITGTVQNVSDEV